MEFLVNTEPVDEVFNFLLSDDYYVSVIDKKEKEILELNKQVESLTNTIENMTMEVSKEISVLNSEIIDLSEKNDLIVNNLTTILNNKIMENKNLEIENKKLTIELDNLKRVSNIKINSLKKKINDTKKTTINRPITRSLTKV